jgi:hypothetical protein
VNSYLKQNSARTLFVERAVHAVRFSCVADLPAVLDDKVTIRYPVFARKLPHDVALDLLYSVAFANASAP